MREHRDAGTGGHINMVVFNIQRMQQIIHNGFRANFGFAWIIQVTQHNRKFIATNAGK